VLKRRNNRAKRIFTIDPLTATDLDDALSITGLGDGLVEVGAHITDLAHFSKDGSAVDLEAQHHATSAYLVSGVVPMLPPLL
jgi:exoribonuclease R